MLPGIATIASSPSQVLQIQPFLENFCTYPARSPVEYVQETTSQVYRASSTTGTAITPAMMSFCVRESVNVTPGNLASDGLVRERFACGIHIEAADKADHSRDPCPKGPARLTTRPEGRKRGRLSRRAWAEPPL